MIVKILILILAFFVFPKPAQAYLDPGAGSYIIQVLIGTVLAVLYLIKTLWKQITLGVQNLVKYFFKKS